MKSILDRMTGATVKLDKSGSNVKIAIAGAASQVKHAVTLLYNYHAIGNVPEWYDESFQYMELSASWRGFLRGMLALVRIQDVIQWHKRDEHRACVKAIVRCAHQVQGMLPRFDMLADDVS